MDQLKTQLALVKQHSFWAMCLGILGVSLGSWWVSTGKLQSEQAAQVGKIKGGFEGVSGVMSQQKHPNDAVIKGMGEVNSKYAKEVLDGWQRQFDHQAGVLVWPASFEKTGFRAYVDKNYRPIEKIQVTDGKVLAKDDLPSTYREEYRDYIEKELPHLAEIIKAHWVVSTQGDPAAGGAPGGAGGFGGAMPSGGVNPAGPIDPATGQPMLTDDSVVIWNSSNQQEILATHFGFTMRSTFPSTLEVLYAQEDYWVLDNIMQIIRATNTITNNKGEREDATARHDAVIKYIDFVRLGRSAYGLAGRIYPVGRATAGGESAGGMSPGGEGAAAAPGGGTADAAGGSATPGGTTGDGMGGVEQMLARDPAMRRYVDDKFQPLDPTRLRGALKSTTPEDALLAVAKRMPVRIRLVIDQRKLNVLLAECGNSKLPVEIHQVRIAKEAAPAAMGGGGGGYAGGGDSGGMPGGGGGFGGGGFGGGGGGFGGGGFGGEGGMPGGGGFGGGGFGGGGFGGGGMPGGGGFMPTPGGDGYGGGGMPGAGGGKQGMVVGSVTSDANVDPNLIPVELYGIVYIYNPANKDQLGVGPPPAEGTPPADPGAPAVPAPTEPVPQPEAAAGTTPPAVVPTPAATTGAGAQ